MQAILKEGQAEIDVKFPMGGSQPCPCFARLWGKRTCTYKPCLSKRAHDEPFADEAVEAAKAFLNKKGLPATFQDWCQANPSQ